MCMFAWQLSAATPDEALDASVLRVRYRIKFQHRLENPPPIMDAMVTLKRGTYKKKFHSLLHLEELEHLQVLENRLVQ